jgi:hypothetical protein
MSNAQTWGEFKREIVEIANENIALMDGTTKPVQELFRNAEIVWGIWQDANEPDGIGTLVMKGAKLLREIGSNGKDMPNVVFTAIPCVCLEQAIAARNKFGTPDADA